MLTVMEQKIMLILVHLAPETYNKFQDEDGCPDYVADNKLTADTDNDGIVDYLDLCPTQPETFNGIYDADGCPDRFDLKLDSDMQMGLLDAL